MLRITRLMATLRPVRSDRCKGGPTRLVAAGDLVNPADVPRCRYCRGPHLLVVGEVVVATREDKS